MPAMDSTAKIIPPQLKPDNQSEVTGAINLLSEKTQTTELLTTEPPRKPLSLPLVFLTTLIIVVSALTIALLPSLKPQTQQQKTTVAEVVKPALFITLDSPVDASLISENMVTIRGKTLPNTPVVMYSESDENSTDSDQNGSFEASLQLEEGINTLTVTAYGDQSEEQTISMDVVSESNESENIYE